MKSQRFVIGLVSLLSACTSAPTKVTQKSKPFRSVAASDYWSDIVNLCKMYSSATHPPCNSGNGADMILDEVAHDCIGNDVCLKKAVNLCIMYSPATHPPCNAENGLDSVLAELRRVAQFNSIDANEKAAQAELPAIPVGSGRASTVGEARLICNALESSIEAEGHDGLVRKALCYARQGRAHHLDEDRTEIELKIPLYIESHPGEETCRIVYLHRSAHAKNVEGTDGKPRVSCE